MKKRNRSRRQQHNPLGRGLLNLFTKPAQRERRAWTFERLEERYLFSAAPLTGMENWQWATASNNTAEGQQLIDAIQQLWAMQSSANAGSGSSVSQAETRSVPTDPYFQYQWHLFNVGQVVNPGQFQDLFGVPGQDINVIPAWDQGLSGAGVNVAVVDSGVQLNHPDLVQNLGPGYDPLRNIVGGGPVGDEGHGTAVAGLIAATANNGIGGTGVAFGATIIPIRLISAQQPFSDAAFVQAIGANGTPIDIYNHSWGPSDAVRNVDGPNAIQLIALTNSARLGRNGLGAIHVWAAGNGAEALDSASSDGYVNSRYTIAVGIVDHDGQRANSDGTSTGYGEMGPSVLIVAPSASGPTDIINNFATGSGIFTTDLTNGGYNVPPLPSGIELDIDAFPDSNYTSRFGGTSASAPIVSGVIALMLEANPNLTYRDVQEILVRSARQNNDLDESWITNLVPLFRDPIPGFGNYGEVYPNDGDPWNDEIVYQLIPGMILEPAVQATTDPITVAGGGTFSIHPQADQAWDGWVANNLTVTFRTNPGGNPGATAQVIEGEIRITVSGTGVTWGEIKAAVELLGEDPMDPAIHWFDLLFADPATADVVFEAADELIRVQLTGGLDAVGISEEDGVESIIVRNPQYFGYHPIADPLTNPEPLSLFTNGAGYTVSHGRGGNSEYGWAHGVVDAGLAVELAKQWHIKDQNLPSEKTYFIGSTGGIPIRGAQETNEDSGEYLIPGALSNSGDSFAEYFNEFFKEPTIEAGEAADPMDPMSVATPDRIDPMSLPFAEDDPPGNTRGTFFQFDVPAVDPVSGGSNLMTMEWVEVKLRITGDADAMNYLRITLVSPDGTHSEFTQNQYDPANITNNFQHLATGGVFTGFGGGSSITNADDMGMSTNTLDWVFSTNRVWGERSDTRFEYDEFGNVIDFHAWELHFENYSGATLNLNDVQIAFHGTPIGSSAAAVERVSGKVGVDSGRFILNEQQILGANDGQFNFDRYLTTTSNNSHALTTSSFFGGFSTTPFGEHEVRVVDPLQESFAENITVYVIDNSTGQRVAQFVTGADGNYYFDLPAGEYTLGIEDPLGRAALDNEDGFRNYDNEWVITVDGDDQFIREAGEIDEVTGKVHLFNDFHFLLDPGSIPVDEVVFTGQVVGDLNGNGAQDPRDVGVFKFTVFADLNHTGQFELGEPFTLTDEDGFYELNVPTATPNTFSITVKPPGGWTPTSPATGVINEYALPGELVEGFKFLVAPPSSPTGIGNGTIFGFAFNDRNGDGIQGVNEFGKEGITVFIDTDLDGVFDNDGTEPFTVTSSSGAYQFGDLAPGSYRIDAVVEDPLVLIAPGAGFITVSLVAGQVSTGNTFAIQNLAVNDFGDLIGAGFQSEAASSFAVPGFSLGSRIDAEARPRYLILDPSVLPDDPLYPQFIVDPAAVDGEADDQEVSLENFDDEDGIVLVGGVLRPGANTLSVTVQGVGGYLQGWIDFDNSGTFDTGEQVFANQDLNQGTFQLLVTAPQSLVTGQVAARFRWGSPSMTFNGHDTIGEIEDYMFAADAPIVLPLGDYNGDLLINQDDYRVWKSTFGSTTDLRADGNMNGVIDLSDYTVWRNAMGASPGAGSGSAAGLAFAAEESQNAGGGSIDPVLEAQIREAWIATLRSRQTEPLSPGEVARLGQQGAVATDFNGQARYSVFVGASSPTPDTPPVEERSESGSAAVTEVDSSQVAQRLNSADWAFTTTVGHAAGPSRIYGHTNHAANGVDMALLLMAQGAHRERSTSDDDMFASDADWICEHNKQDGDTDLALAAAFEDEGDWRYAL